MNNIARTKTTMTELIAKPILKNKFWVVEDHGNQVATIQAVDNGGFVYVDTNNRTRFPSIKLLSKEYNITFDKDSRAKTKPVQEHSVYGYPVTNKPWNILWDVKHQFGVFTKTNKSKSYYCAGHYIIKFNNGWVKSFCPKLITLNRYPFQGPFMTKEQMQEALKAANGK
jgi:hypothetical protein